MPLIAVEITSVPDAIKKRLITLYMLRQNLMHTVRFLQWLLDGDKFMKQTDQDFKEFFDSKQWPDSEKEKYDKIKAEKQAEIIETIDTRLAQMYKVD